MTLKELLAQENLKHDDKIGDEIALEIALIDENGACQEDAYLEDCRCVSGDIEDIESLYDCEVVRHYYDEDYYDKDFCGDDYYKTGLIIFVAEKKEKEND